MHANFLVLANFASQLGNGSPVLVGVFRGVVVSSFPARLEPFWIATEIEAEPQEEGRHVFNVRLIDEDGGVVYSNVIEVEFRKRPNFLPNYIYFCGQVFVEKSVEKPGVYRLDLEWNGTTLAQTRLEIEIEAKG